MSRALANLRLGENQKAHDDLEIVIRKNPITAAVEHQVIALARLARKQEALSELAKIQKGDASEGSRLGLAIVAAAELGEGLDGALETLEAAIHRAPRDKELIFDAARCRACLARDLPLGQGTSESARGAISELASGRRPTRRLGIRRQLFAREPNE